VAITFGPLTVPTVRTIPARFPGRGTAQDFHRGFARSSPAANLALGSQELGSWV
jgi:hypothetical protein